MLTSVEFVLRNQQRGSSQHIGDIVSNFLGPAPDLSLSDACKLGSIRLLDWMWSVSCTPSAQKPSRWSLCNYLRSDRRYQQWQFSKSLSVAIELGDTEMVAWILSHFEDCKLASKVLGSAVEGGRFEAVKALLKYHFEQQRQEDPEIEDGMTWYVGADVICSVGSGALEKACKNGHPEIAQWLYENTTHVIEFEEEETEGILLWARENRATALAAALLPADQRISQFFTVEDVEQMLGRGGLTDANKAVQAIAFLAEEGRLDLIQRISQLHSPPPADDFAWSSFWYDALYAACERGDVTMFKWLEEHPTGRKKCDELKESSALSRSSQFLVTAAGQGDTDMLNHLYEAGFTDDGGWAMSWTLQRGPVSSARWLLEHYTYRRDQFFLNNYIMDLAAARVDMLQFFHDYYDPMIDRAAIKRRRLNSGWWLHLYYAMQYAAQAGKLDAVKFLHYNRFVKSMDAITEAAGEGHLEVVQWLLQHRKDLDLAHTMDRAAATGHLDIVKFLHANGCACTTKAMDEAAKRGDLEMVEWLHVNRTAGCTADALNAAAGNGDLRMVKWIIAHYPKLSKKMAMANAVNNGRLRVAYWLHGRFSECNLAKQTSLKWSTRSLDMVLFLRRFYPEILTRKFIEELPVGSETRKWLEENTEGTH